MEHQEDYKNPLNSIPQKKIEYAVQQVLNSIPDTRGKNVDEIWSDPLIAAQIEAIYRYAEANIPVDYWFLNMNTDFKGDKTLFKKFVEITTNISNSYNKGVKICFAGKHGTGKTFTCASILKTAVEKGFSGLYVTLSDVVSLMTSNNVEGKTKSRQLLLDVDFLVIDEFDPRFMATNNASDLYGRILEQTLRTRVQNKMPLFLCTNSPNPLNTFQGPLKESLTSLMHLVQMIAVLDNKDFRPERKNEQK